MPDFFSDPGDVTPAIEAGRKAKYGRLGSGSFVLDTAASLAGKRNSQRYFDSTYENLTRPLMNADERIGAAIAGRSPDWLRGLMTREEMLPLNLRGPGGGQMHVKRRAASAVEPLMKAKRLAVPIAAAMAVGSVLGQDDAPHQREASEEELLRALRYQYDAGAFTKAGEVMPSTHVELTQAADHIEKLAEQNRDAIEKLAAYDLEKQAQDCVWDMVARNIIPPPATKEEFQAKVAAVLQRGPTRTRDAMDLVPDLPNAFELDKNAGVGTGSVDPLTAFVLGH